MTKENKLIMSERSQFTTVLLFKVFEMDFDFDHEHEVGCAEDVEYRMRMFLEKNWCGLFEGTNVDHRPVCDVAFTGFHVLAKNEYGLISYAMGNKEHAIATINTNVLCDENADKIKKIRDIIG